MYISVDCQSQFQDIANNIEGEVKKRALTPWSMIFQDLLQDFSSGNMHSTRDGDFEGIIARPSILF